VLPLREVHVLHRLARRFDAPDARRVAAAQLKHELGKRSGVGTERGLAEEQDVGVRREPQQVAAEQRRAFEIEPLTPRLVEAPFDLGLDARGVAAAEVGLRQVGGRRLFGDHLHGDIHPEQRVERGAQNLVAGDDRPQRFAERRRVQLPLQPHRALREEGAAVALLQPEVFLLLRKLESLYRLFGHELSCSPLLRVLRW
jgi:hypothetical protein